MGMINNIIDSVVYAFSFRETVFYKNNSDLENKYKALINLNKKIPNDKDLIDELNKVKKGLDGENEVAYQLKKSHIGMYVLRDVKIKYEDLSAQVDYIIITPIYTYYVECKNLIGNITVNEKGDFIREIFINGKKTKKGMYSPLRQVESQREVIRKVWESNSSKIKKIFSSKNFDYYKRVLVVVTNQDTVLNTNKAPKEIKYKVLRADNLIRQIEYDLNHAEKDEYLDSKETMKKRAQAYIDVAVKHNVDYYAYYKSLFSKKNNYIKNKLIDFRTKRSKEMKIPAYFVFTNNELDKIVKVKPKTIEELKQSNILSDIKIEKHGRSIIEIINSAEKNKNK